ncbi:MAG: O-antigen ligase family protein [Agathobacter sp.]
MKEYTPYKWILLILGVLATMPIIEINISFLSISAFRFFLFITIFIMLIQSNFTVPAVFRNRFIVWMLWSLISCACGYLFFFGNAQWQQASISNITKIIAYLIFALLWFGQKNLSDYNKVVLKGLFIGAIANIIWATIDAACFYGLGFSLSNMVFARYGATHDVIYGTVSLIINNGRMIRSAGFNYDPAHLGFLIPFVMGYGFMKKKYLYLLLGGLGIIASASTTSLVCSILSIAVCVTMSTKTKIGTKGIIGVFFGAFVMVFVFVLFGDKFMPLIRQATLLFGDRVNTVYVSSDTSNIRLEYIKYLPLAILELGPLLLTGTGYGTASYGYCHNSYTLSKLNIKNVPYDMENTYIAYLLDTGIIGLFLFFYLLFPLYSYYKKNGGEDEENIIYIAILSATIFSLFFYHYILFVPQILSLIFALSNREKRTLE